MLKLKISKSAKSGLGPGTMVHLGRRRTEKIKIFMVDYDHSNYEEKTITQLEEILPYLDKPTITWVNISGLHRLETIEKIGGMFNLHPLTLEDIVNTEMRPKVDNFYDYIYMALKMFYLDKDKDSILVEQISVIMGRGFVITLQETDKDIFDCLRKRIETSHGRIRKGGTDYLFYSILDTIVDSYFTFLEWLGEKIESLDDELMDNPRKEILYTIHELKNDMIYIRRSIWPLREMINTLRIEETPLIQQTTDIFIRDLHDHVIEVMDLVETYRETMGGILDTYLSSVSNKLNEIMKVLTIIATIFIPLTFIVGFFGMNFVYSFIPWKWYWGMPVSLVIMLLTTFALILYFRRRGWL